MRHHVLHHATDALGVLDQHGHLGGTLGQVVAILFGEVAGDQSEGFVDSRAVDLQPHFRRFEMQRQGGLVTDGLLEGVAAQVALVVLVGTEGPEGVVVGTVDGCAGEAKQERIGQRLAHLATEVAFLGAMGFVDHDDDVRAFVEPAAGLAELVDGGNEHLAHVLPEQLLQLLAGGHADHVGHVGGVEGGADLGVEIDAVHHDDDRGVAECGVQSQLLRREDHQQRLATALEMRDEALLRVTPHDAGDDLVGGVVLLIAADDLDASVLLVGGKDGEVLQDVHHHRGP